MKHSIRWFGIVLLVLGVVLGGLLWRQLTSASEGEDGAGEGRPAPVAVGTVEQGPIELRRTFSGTLEAHSEFLVAPKIGGSIEAVHLDFSDRVRRGQVVAELDDAEIVQEVLRAEADLAVAEANLAEAQSLREISQREIERFDTLRERGFTSASQYETAEAESLARQAQLHVAEAQLRRAQAVLESARIREGYAQVRADWSGPGEERLVAERFVEAGDTIAANEPILRIVEIDPVTAVIFVTERDYARLEPGQPATFETDVFPGEVFTGEVERVAPVFREATRQARVELAIPNEDGRLKPGMFVRVRLTLAREEEATIVPVNALTRRQGREGVFIVSADGETVRWAPVRVGVQDGTRVAVEGEQIEGRVVVLGQQLVEDGSPIVIAEEEPPGRAS